MKSAVSVQQSPDIRLRPGIHFKGYSEAQIESLSHDGRGVAHNDGKTVFIDGALPGEYVRYGLIRRKQKHDNGIAVEILKVSPERVCQPRCPQFGLCGGCRLQHLEAQAQISHKSSIVRENLQHIGSVSPESWLPAILGPAWAYRRKARLGVRWVPKKGGVLVGFREKGNSYITNIDHCPVLDPRLSRLIPGLRNVIQGLSCPSQIPQIEVAAGDENVALVFRHRVALTDEDLQDLCTFGRQNSTHIFLQAGGPDTIQALVPESPPRLNYYLPDFDTTIRFQATDFTQINIAVNRQMVSQAIDLLEPGSGDRVLDLFCGLGNFTLPIARRAESVLGIEGDKGLIKGARDNARDNGITNVRFEPGDLYSDNTGQSWSDFRFNKLIIDPPRSGALEAIKQLHAPYPDRIIYVSCNPASLARDARYLVQELGYIFRAAGIMDMFPQTSHVESIALFVKQCA